MFDRMAMFNAFVNGEAFTLHNIVDDFDNEGCRELTGIIQSIEREDGSGFNFNIVIDVPVTITFGKRPSGSSKTHFTYVVFYSFKRQEGVVSQVH